METKHREARMLVKRGPYSEGRIITTDPSAATIFTESGGISAAAKIFVDKDRFNAELKHGNAELIGDDASAKPSRRRKKVDSDQGDEPEADEE